MDNPPKTVVITSSVPAEGKSTTACNLAIALAQAGSRVLLVEADLRRPKVAEYLRVDGSRGLTDVLIGAAAAGQHDRPLAARSAGLPARRHDPAQPQRAARLTPDGRPPDGTRRRYDVILLDAPPLLPVTDAAILATAADGAILVARSGKTRKEQVEHSADALRQVNARLLGTVLNFAPQRKRRGYGDGYGTATATDMGTGASRPGMHPSRRRGRTSRSPVGRNEQGAHPPKWTGPSTSSDQPTFTFGEVVPL